MTADIRRQDVAGRQNYSWGVDKCPLFGGNFVLQDASLDFASVRCPEQRGCRFSEATFTIKAC